MLPARLPSPDTFSARAAARDLVLWTTKDGREIPLDEMSCDHIANAIRVLALWRTRIKKRSRDGTVVDDSIVRDLADAISRFKAVQRRRRKCADPSVGRPVTSVQSPSASRRTLRRKPVAST